MSAVPAPETGPDAGAMWHFGDPFGEQRAAAEHAVVVVDRSHRAVITLTGNDRKSWLHTISTQHVSDLPDGAVTQNLSLDAQGRVEDHWIQTELDGVTYHRHRAVARGAAAGVPAQDGLLGRRRRRARRPGGAVAARPARGRPASARRARRWSAARRGSAVPLAGGGFAAQDARRGRGGPGGTARRGRPAGGRACVAAGVRPAGVWAYEAHRVAGAAAATRRRHRRADDPPRGRLDRRTGEAPCISTRAAIAARKPSRACTTWANRPACWCCCTWTAPADRPATGDPVLAGGRAVGRLGTVVDHVDLGPIALALLKRGVPADTS